MNNLSSNLINIFNNFEKDCSVVGWDGYLDTEPVNIASLAIVKNVLSKLFSNYTLPDPHVNCNGEDGSVSFGWTGVEVMPQFYCNVLLNSIILNTAFNTKEEPTVFKFPELDETDLTNKLYDMVVEKLQKCEQCKKKIQELEPKIQELEYKFLLLEYQYDDRYNGLLDYNLKESIMIKQSESFINHVDKLYNLFREKHIVKNMKIKYIDDQYFFNEKKEFTKELFQEMLTSCENKYKKYLEWDKLKTFGLNDNVEKEKKKYWMEANLPQYLTFGVDTSHMSSFRMSIHNVTNFSE